MTRTPYATRIAEIDVAHDPRHIEAYMRVKYSTLDGLSADEFDREVRLAGLCVEEGGRALAERIASSFG